VVLYQKIHVLAQLIVEILLLYLNGSSVIGLALMVLALLRELFVQGLIASEDFLWHRSEIWSREYGDPPPRTSIKRVFS
jgi:hypothetical protein